MPLRRTISTIAFALFFLTAWSAAIIFTGCAPALAPEPEWEKSARAHIEQAEASFSKKLYEQASKSADGFFMLYPKSRYTDRALHLKGEIRLVQRDCRQALSYYKEIIERFPSSPLIPDSRYKLGLCYFELKEYDLAAANLQDRSGIADPERLRHISEMLSFAYVLKKSHFLASKEFVYLAETAKNEKQRESYREKVREIVEGSLNEDELKSLSAAGSYPADIALLRLAALLIQQRKYKDAITVSREFLDRFPAHPEKTRGQMLLSEAQSRMTAPRHMIGALLPQSGPLAFFGDRVLKGMELAVHVHNMKEFENRVDVILKDTEGLPEKTVAGLEELASKGVAAIIGPVTTKDEEAITPLLAGIQIPVIRPAASRSGFNEKSDWMFRNGLTIDSQVRVAAEYAIERQFTRFAIMYPDEPYGKDLSNLFSKELERKIELLANIAYSPETKDFGPYIRRLIEIDLRSRKIQIPDDEAERKKLFAEYVPGFEALYLPGYAEQVGLLIPQLAFYNVKGVALIGSDNWHSQDLIERAGRHAEGSVFVDGFLPESRNPVIASFVEAYRSAFREEPDILSAQAYDAAMMVFSLLKQNRETPVAVRDGLLALKNYQGVSGLTTFDGSREAEKQLFLIKVDNGKFKPVHPER